MAWVAVDYIGEWIFNCKPDMWAGDCIEHNYWLPQDRHGAYGFQLPQGSIKKLIGRELSFSDDAVELKQIEYGQVIIIWNSWDVNFEVTYS